MNEKELNEIKAHIEYMCTPQEQFAIGDIWQLRDNSKSLLAEVERLNDDFGDANRTATKLIAENIALEAHNSILMSALEDMLLLIEEHGIKSVIRAHATRILAARNALKGGEGWRTNLTGG